MNRVVSCVRDARRQKQFYEDVRGFSTIIDRPGPFAADHMGAGAVKEGPA